MNIERVRLMLRYFSAEESVRRSILAGRMIPSSWSNHTPEERKVALENVRARKRAS